MAFMDQFNRSPQHGPQPTEMKAKMSMLRQMMQGDPTPIINNLMQTNPSFAQFAQQIKGKTPQEAFQQYGYDFDEVSRLINS